MLPQRHLCNALSPQELLTKAALSLSIEIRMRPGEGQTETLKSSLPVALNRVMLQLAEGDRRSAIRTAKHFGRVL